MLIWEHADGTATWTGSFNAADWADYMSKRETGEDAPVSEPVEPQSVEPGRPAGNASLEAWRGYALTQGAAADEIADLTRNELRDLYGGEE